jgi:hypothetical protein
VCYNGHKVFYGCARSHDLQQLSLPPCVGPYLFFSLLPDYRLRRRSQETATRTTAVASSRYIQQHRPTARHRLSPSDQLLVQSSAAMGSITAQSTFHIPAIFRTLASIMELARPLGERRRNLIKEHFSYMGVVVRLGPGVSKIIKSELRSRLRAAFLLATSAMLHVCSWHLADMPQWSLDVRSWGVVSTGRRNTLS